MARRRSTGGNRYIFLLLFAAFMFIFMTKCTAPTSFKSQVKYMAQYDTGCAEKEINVYPMSHYVYSARCDIRNKNVVYKLDCRTDTDCVWIRDKQWKPQ